jgi:hypothetical protein
MAGQWSRIGWAVLVGMLIGAPVMAHHAVSAEFDPAKPVKFTGTIKKIEWMNPHIYTQVEVKQPDGSTIVYRVEGGPPNSLYRQGWRKEDLKIGQVVTVSGIRAKSETSMNVGQATITMPDGRRIYGGAGPRGEAQQP